MDRLQKIVDLRLGRVDRRLDATLCSAFLAQMQLPDPAPLNLGELDHCFAFLAQIAYHLYDDLVYYSFSQPAAFEKQDSVRPRRETPVMSYDDHPDLQVIHDRGEKLVQNFSVRAVEIARRLVRQEDARIHRERPRHSCPLLLASGQLRRAVRHASSQPDTREEL